MSSYWFGGEGLGGKPFSVAGFQAVPLWPSWITRSDPGWPTPGRLVRPLRALQFFYSYTASFPFHHISNTVTPPGPSWDAAVAATSEITARLLAVCPAVFVGVVGQPPTFNPPFDPVPRILAVGNLQTTDVTSGTSPKLGVDFLSIAFGDLRQDDQAPGSVIAGLATDTLAPIIASRMSWVSRYTAAWWGMGAPAFAGPAIPIPFPGDPSDTAGAAAWAVQVGVDSALWNTLVARASSADAGLITFSDALNAQSCDRLTSQYYGDFTGVTADAIAAIIKDAWGIDV